ncbi:MAG: hypothetical protein M1820_007568 [Bogoriella megaspora]|nr:MAG: hypothetical protein M1820_007568 [Bogoriella megaspora]
MPYASKGSECQKDSGASVGIISAPKNLNFQAHLRNTFRTAAPGYPSSSGVNLRSRIPPLHDIERQLRGIEKDRAEANVYLVVGMTYELLLSHVVMS